MQRLINKVSDALGHFPGHGTLLLKRLVAVSHAMHRYYRRMCFLFSQVSRSTPTLQQCASGGQLIRNPCPAPLRNSRCRTSWVKQTWRCACLSVLEQTPNPAVCTAHAQAPLLLLCRPLPPHALAQAAKVVVDEVQKRSRLPEGQAYWRLLGRRRILSQVQVELAGDDI